MIQLHFPHVYSETGAQDILAGNALSSPDFPMFSENVWQSDPPADRRRCRPNQTPTRAPDSRQCRWSMHRREYRQTAKPNFDYIINTQSTQTNERRFFWRNVNKTPTTS